MARLVVTGGGGFVGSHLVDRLLQEGHTVVAIDNLVTGSATNLAHLSRETKFTFIEADVSKSFPSVGKIDGIYHMASPASPIDFVPLAIPILQAGSYGTFHALEVAEQNQSWFLMASTSEIYGDPLVHPQTEEYWGNVNPIGTRGVYDEAKRFSEAVTMAYSRAKKAKTSIVRIFNTYGPRMRPNDGRVVPNFIRQALEGEALTVYGDGKQTRSLCYVTDLVEGLFQFFKVQPASPINLGNDREVTVQAIGETIVKLASSSSKLKYLPLPDGDPKQRCPNIEKAKKILGWKPTIAMEEGLKKTIEYFRSSR